MYKNRLAGLALLFFAAISCKSYIPEPGVPQDLAIERAAIISKLGYSICFDLTSVPGNVVSNETISFNAARRKPVALDFKAPESSLISINANGRVLAPAVVNEHVIIPRRCIAKGDNTIKIDFLAGEQSLNRRDGFMFTLLVPDRARTLFPCFDQPDLKAEFRLSLTVPEGWIAVSNTAAVSHDGTTISFAPTEPLSSYLFSFAAGRFERLEATRNGRTVSMYHRENDPAKIAGSDEIFKLVFDSLDWMEDYTGIPYPFSKYDFVVLPDFQYGGMEHTGATLYNDKRIFLGPDPTTDELLSRASLIAHETSHMWFGDFVTMKWFNDVWTKEVFANWFAAQIIRPLFPEVNHSLSDMMNYYAPAYSEDRTKGSNAIQRPLENLQDAGLIYCNIIYDKAPVVMDMLARKLGAEKLRTGLHEYLQRFGFSNATWDDLIAILDSLTDEDIAAWSDIWIKEEGMPVYEGRIEDGVERVIQRDPFGKGREWEQELNNSIAEGKYWIPNMDGKAYGWFLPDAGSMEYIMSDWCNRDENARMSLLMTLYENSWHGTLDRTKFIHWCVSAMAAETNPLILSSLLSYSGSEARKCSEGCFELSEALQNIASDTGRGREIRLLSFRSFVDLAQTESQWEEIYRIWSTCTPYEGLILSEKDYTDMTYQLMIAMPEEAERIASVQRERITNPDRLATFEYVCQAASPSYETRQEFFASLLESPENRRPESRVLSALALLCHCTRQEEALNYIVPSLDALQEIQRTGDIFFPASWCRTLLSKQHNEEAGRIVKDYLATHPDMNPLLVTKVLQALDE
ncbi:MAG: M1 family aminopeptidase [Bacteroidia bacterium]|nr:M1 family aminopeptidase [Bacteroidia bacterium]